MLYGATGYTGQLIAEEALARGHRPVLAGRSRQKLEPLANRLGLPWRAFGLEDAAEVRSQLNGIAAVLHAAGPFTRTSRPMVDACLAAGAHYLDITGELPVFVEIFLRDAEARAAGVCLLPGVGFDVVPSDCLLAHVSSRVGGARSLELGLAAIGQPSGGTARSAVELLPGGNFERRGGRLEEVPFLTGARELPFPGRTAWALPSPLADLETAAHSTGATDVRTYLAVPGRVGRAVSRPVSGPVLRAGLWAFRRVMQLPAVKDAVGAAVHRANEGPDAGMRQTGRSALWARAEAADGRWTEATLVTLEGYELTKVTSVRAVEAVLASGSSGARTPSQVLGADFVLGLPRTERADR